MTIVFGLLVGLSLAAAVELSLALGLLTLGVTTIWQAVQRGPHLIQAFGWLAPAVGLAAAAIAGFAGARGMQRLLRRRGLEVFGWYRIAAAVLLVVLAATGVRGS